VSRNGSGRLGVTVSGLAFDNPIVLAAGTAGYGEELRGVIDLDAIGGFVTKAVSAEPRAGAPAPRVAEFDGGMINAVGLANPGLERVVADAVPWLAAHHPTTRKIANVVGFTVDEFSVVTDRLSEAADRFGGALDAFELNVSCPNVKAGGMEFGADPASLAAVVRGARARTTRPLFVKLSPMLPDIAAAARIAVDSGADAITLVNTIPGLVIDVEHRRPALGFGSGGVSGTGLLPVGVLATWKVSRAVRVPIMGIGGVSRGADAVQYLMAGASLVGIGTGALRDPRAPERVVRELDEWCASHGVTARELVGSLQWPS
jgi:dihydroorotate dehydrogenase (NAD+) catalytic subunit